MSDRTNVLSHFILVFLAILLFSAPVAAEELEPRRWSHLPIDTSFLGAAYAYTTADIHFDPVLRLENVKMGLQTVGVKYIRSFALFEKSARLGILSGYQDGTWTGLVDDVPTKVSRSGATDTVVRLAINLYGAPPLQGKEYSTYRVAREKETIVGAAFSVQLPTGDYQKDKLINLGSNRYTLRPQIGAVHTRGKWSFEATGTMAIYTDNDEFFNGNKLEQDPLYTINSHLIYTFRPGVWASSSLGYDFGGESTLNGVAKADRKGNVAWAITCGFPLHRRLGVKVNYIGIRAQEKTGSDSDTGVISFSTFW